MKTIEALKTAILAGEYDSLFQTLQPPGGDSPGGMAAYRERWRGLLDRFAERFGADEPVAIFSTPGRTEIGGNHTDHQHGCVLAGSVTMDLIAVARKNGSAHVRLASEGYLEQTVDLCSLDPQPDERNDSRALVRGIAARFTAEGYAVGGYDVCMASNVLKGSGLSSSAAFEVMIGTIVNHLFADGRVDPVEVCKIGKYAENVYFGKPSGLMDQVACCMGGVVFIDFEDVDNPVIKQVPFDLAKYGLALCVLDSGADHADMTDAYSPIPIEMGAVAAYFGETHLRRVNEDAFMDELPAIRREAGDRAVLRALHFFADSRRAREEADAIEKGDIDRFLRLVKESGRSSHMYLQNIFPPGDARRQDVGVALALCDEFLGGRGAFRVHGGGFAGTVQAFVPLDILDRFKHDTEAVLGEGRCHVLGIRPKGSIRIA